MHLTGQVKFLYYHILEPLTQELKDQIKDYTNNFSTKNAKNIRIRNIF